MGYSQGGRIALEAALAHPSRFKGLFRITPTLSGAPAPQYDLATERILELQRQAELAGGWERVNHIKVHLWLDGPLVARNARLGRCPRTVSFDERHRPGQPVTWHGPG